MKLFNWINNTRTVDQKTITIFYMVILALFSFLIAGYRFSLCPPYITFEDFLKQNYSKPFVNRALIVWIAKLIVKYSSVSSKYIFFILEFAALILSGFYFSKYINIFIKNKNISRILSFSLYFIIPFELILPRYIPLWYPYDTYSLLFFICGLILIHNRNFRWFYPLFIIATFNRETSCFLTVVMLFVWWKRMPNKTLLLHLSVQFIIWVTIKLFLNLIFANQPGSQFSDQLFYNLNFFSTVYFSVTTSWAIKLPSKIESIFRLVYILGNFGFIYMLIIIFWQKLDNIFLRRATLAVIPFYLSMLYVGLIYEYRIFGEIIPLVLMPALYILVKIIKEMKEDNNRIDFDTNKLK